MKVKICGITDVETACYSASLGVDALGFVFAPSKRRISPEEAKKIIDRLPDTVEKIGVFVNEDVQIIEEIATYCGLTMIQLHGEESNEVIASLSYPVVKAVGIENKEDVQRAEMFHVPYLLVDSPKGTQYYGGNGEKFDWQLLNGMNRQVQQLILAGGLTVENVGIAISMVQPYMVDVSSGVETDGKKDWDKIKAFLQATKGNVRE